MKQRLPRKGKFPDTELSFRHTFRKTRNSFIREGMMSKNVQECLRGFAIRTRKRDLSLLQDRLIIRISYSFQTFPPSKIFNILYPWLSRIYLNIYIEIINIDRCDTIKGFISEEAFSIYGRKVPYTIITADMFHQDTAAINYVKAAWRNSARGNERNQYLQ